jgi:hypothetical protein
MEVVIVLHGMSHHYITLDDLVPITDAGTALQSVIMVELQGAAVEHHGLDCHRTERKVEVADV